MKNTKTLILGATTLVLAIFLALSVWYKSSQATKQAKLIMEKQAQLERPYSVTLGPDDAKVTLVEFLDPECETCRAFFPFVKKIIAEHPDDIRLVVRYAPFHANARFAIKIIEAARKQDKYWEALSAVFYFQPNWGNHQDPKPELIWDYLPEAGIDVDQVRAVLDDPEVEKHIEQDRLDAVDLQVRATPSFFVNGKPLAEFGFNQLQAAIDAELE